MTNTIIYQISTIKQWIRSLLELWDCFAHKEHKKKNKKPLKISPLQVLKVVA